MKDSNSHPKQEQEENTEVSSRLYSTNGAYQEPEIYLSLCLS